MDLKEQLNELIATSKTKLAEIGEKSRISLRVGWNVFQQALSEITVLIERVYLDVTGPEKKKAAMDAAEVFFDSVLTAVLLPYIPSFLQWIFKTQIRYIFLQLANGSIDALVATFNSLGIFSSKNKDKGEV